MTTPSTTGADTPGHPDPPGRTDTPGRADALVATRAPEGVRTPGGHRPGRHRAAGGTRRVVGALLALALAVFSAGCADEADESPVGSDGSTSGRSGAVEADGDGSGSMAWESCGNDTECAEMDVPVDYENPDGETIELSVVRAPADGDRIGALFVNPGGPGGIATEYAVNLAATLPSEVTDHFDIVGVDPRGLGASAINCSVDAVGLYELDHSIDSRQDEEELLEASEDYVDSCEAVAGDLLAHLGTANVARDIDQVREAMGDEQASFLMSSYGTAIAQVYADMFPDRVRAMVIDGIVDLEMTGVEAATAQAVGFEDSLAAFLADCDADDSCPIGPDAEESLDELIAAVEEEPIPASPRDLGPGEMSTGLGLGLYSDTLWDRMANAIADALDGDGTAMVAMADAYTEGADFDIYFAVNCIDFAWPDDPAELLAAGEDAAAEAPRFGESIVNDYVRCPLWPVEGEPLEPVTAAGTPPILVVATTNDPATPYAAAERTAERLEDAVLLTYEGDGHGIVGQGVACIDDRMTAYLVDLEVPADGTVCD